MREGSIKIGIIVIIVSAFIYYIKNQDLINSFIEKIAKLKIGKIFFVAIIIFVGLYIYKTGKHVYSVYDLNEGNKENEALYRDCDEKTLEEQNFYKTVIILNYEKQNYDVPYILDGFKYVEGEWNTGYVIEDNNSNQYVWVPCTNKNIENVPILKKIHFSNKELISSDYCYDLKYEEFLKSALENGGFYISRFEIGKENNKPVSKKDVNIWNNISINDAIKLSKEMYNNNSFECELINGYAYDTALEWINIDNDVNTKNEENREEYVSGRSSINNIYDIYDNVMELTLEKHYDVNIIRGFYNENILNLYDGIINYFENRYSILEEESNNYIGFRTVIYKK